MNANWRARASLPMSRRWFQIGIPPRGVLVDRAGPAEMWRHTQQAIDMHFGLGCFERSMPRSANDVSDGAISRWFLIWWIR